jgi:hypothetical protein
MEINIDWRMMLHDAFQEYRSYRPGKYISQFPELARVAQVLPEDVNARDVDTILWKARHVQDKALFGRFLPEIMNRYVSRALEAQKTHLYATLLFWMDSWTDVQHASITKALLQHWNTSASLHQPPQLAITTSELSFLLLWLEEPTGLESVVQELWARYVSQEEQYEWDATWGSVTWTPFLRRVQEDPMNLLLNSATDGGIGKADLVGFTEIEARVSHFLRKSGVIR